MSALVPTTEDLRAQHILIFDITHDSHFPNFLFHWTDQWLHRDRGRARLSFVVDNYVLPRHAALFKLLSERRESVQLIELSAAEKRMRKNLYGEPGRDAVPFHRVLDSREPQRFGAFYDWQLFCEYAERLQATHAVIAHCDHYLPLIESSGRAPQTFSGIYFAPMFHEQAPGDPAELQTRRLREKFVLARALRHPNLHTLFFLDQTVIPALQSFPNAAKAVYLPEAVSLPKPDPDHVAALKAESGESRVTFLIFGYLSARKGVVQFLEALERLSPESCRKVCVRLGGICDPDLELVLTPLLHRLATNRHVCILRRDKHVPERELAALVHASDVIVTVYQHHAGPSNVNRVAALAGKPVLSSDAGFMGREVQTWGLGLAVDGAQPESIAQGIQQFLDYPPQQLCKREQMAQLAALHTPERFAETFFNRLAIYE